MKNAVVIRVAAPNLRSKFCLAVGLEPVEDRPEDEQRNRREDRHEHLVPDHRMTVAVHEDVIVEPLVLVHEERPMLRDGEGGIMLPHDVGREVDGIQDPGYQEDPDTTGRQELHLTSGAAAIERVGPPLSMTAETPARQRFSMPRTGIDGQGAARVVGRGSWVANASAANVETQTPTAALAPVLRNMAGPGVGSLSDDTPLP